MFNSININERLVEYQEILLLLTTEHRRVVGRPACSIAAA
jgi:hypothetical protein